MSKKNYKRKIMLEFDYGELKAGVKEVSSLNGILNKQFKAASAEAKAYGDKMDELGVRSKYLKERIKIVNETLAENKRKLKEAKETGVEKSVEKYGKSIEYNNAELKKLNAELTGVNIELAKQSKFLGKNAEDWKQFSDKAKGLGRDLTTKLTLPIVAAGAGAFKLASDYEQALGKMEVVFEENTESMKEWASTSLESMSLSRSSAVQIASDFGALFKGMGISMEQTADWSKNLTERVMDLSNFYDSTTEETINALNAIVTGQTEPLRKFGINMTQATLQEYAYSQGINKKVKEMTEAEKVQLRYNFVMERTKIAVGTTAREAGTAGAQMKRFKEVSKELGVTFGEVIIPMIVPLIGKLNAFLQIVAQLDGRTKKLIVTVATIVAVVGPIIGIVGALAGALNNLTTLKANMAAKTVKEGAKMSGALGTIGSAFGGVFIKVMAFIGALTVLVGLIAILTGKGKDIERVLAGVGNTAGKVTGAIRGSTNTINSAKIHGSHAMGLSYVPFDGYRAELHEGERVLTKRENEDYSKGNSGNTVILNVHMDEVSEIHKLMETVKRAKQISRAGGEGFAY